MMGQLTQLELLFHALFACGSEISTAGTFAAVLRSKNSRNESSQERKFQGAKVPHLELLLPGANGLGSKKSSYPSAGVSTFHHDHWPRWMFIITENYQN